VTPPRIVRVSAFAEATADAKRELRRVVGGPGTLVNIDATKERTHEQLLDDIRQRQPDAIFLDGPVPPNTRAVRTLGSEYPIIEEHTELVRSVDAQGPAGEHQLRLGLRSADQIRPLDDGDLARYIREAEQRRKRAGE
jgi:hypothetical protein